MTVFEARDSGKYGWQLYQNGKRLCSIAAPDSGAVANEIAALLNRRAPDDALAASQAEAKRVEKALERARAEGVKQGLEEAACLAEDDFFASIIAAEIRALAEKSR